MIYPFFILLSERRGSNPRPRPWEGRALPTELLSHNFKYGNSSESQCKYKKQILMFNHLSIEIINRTYFLSHTPFHIKKIKIRMRQNRIYRHISGNRNNAQNVLTNLVKQ